MDKNTGAFTRVGNIFHDGKTQNTSELRTATGGIDDKNIFSSTEAYEVSQDAKAKVYESLCLLYQFASLNPRLQCRARFGGSLYSFSVQFHEWLWRRPSYA